MPTVHVVPMVIQIVLKLVDRSRRDNMTWQLVPCVDDFLAEEVLMALSSCLWLVEFQTMSTQVTG